MAGLGRYLYYFTGEWVDLTNESHPRAFPGYLRPRAYSSMSRTWTRQSRRPPAWALLAKVRGHVLGRG
jgi:hypothetical protein